LIIEKITPTEIMETDNLDETERGSDGFGSTGIGAFKENQNLN
jgi:dUTPase